MDPQYAYQSAPANFMPMMAEGGLAAAAQQLQGQGRGGDSMLVHMTPGEVKGLQALAMSQGQSMTVNPTTGLPEASVLKRFLPMIIGAALAPLTAGTSLAFLGNPAVAGLMVGGIETARTGSLKKGVMAGLGAYGGAGLASGLTAAGATAATPPVTGAFDAGQGLSAMQGGAGTVAQPSFAGMGQGVKALGTEAGRSAFTAALPKYAGTAAVMGTANALSEPPKAPTPSESNLRPYEFAWNPQEDAYNPSPTPGDTSERRYFDPRFTAMPVMRAAKGGEVDPTDEMSQDGGYEAGGDVGLKALAKKRRSLRGDPYYKFSQDRRDSSMEAAVEQNLAKGGLSAALPPRFLSGGGDGMSDSIKANIDGKQEARLADGEFVVPADVVSHLGNGSSKAGAKKLYAMMDKIRKARTGSKRQAPEVNAARYMPA